MPTLRLLECQRLTRTGCAKAQIVPREDGFPGFYTYEENFTITPISLRSSPNPDRASVHMPPAALLALVKPQRGALLTLQNLVQDLLLSHSGLRSSSFETYHVAYERALSLARHLVAEDYECMTFTDIYLLRSLSCFIGDSVLLNDVEINASRF